MQPSLVPSTPMELYGSSLYGDPCSGRAWRWTSDAANCFTYVAGSSERYSRLLVGRSGAEQHPQLTWSVTGYVCHVSDNLRLWAERVAGVLRGGDTHVAGYDPDALAVARQYEQVSLAAALWSLENSAVTWVQVLTQAVDEGTVLMHATRGPQSAYDVVINNAHDAHHHAWDIKRILARIGEAE